MLGEPAGKGRQSYTGGELESDYHKEVVLLLHNRIREE